MLRALAHAFLGGGDPSAVLKGLTYGPGPWNLKEPFCSYRWGDKINDSYLSIVSIRTEVQLSRSIKCWESLPCMSLAVLVVPHFSSLEFQITQGVSKSQWGQPTQSSLQQEQDLIADTIQAEEYKQGYGWLRVVTWGCMITQAFYWLFYMTLTL